MSELKDFLPSGGSNKPQIDENTRRTLLINNPNLLINGCLTINQRNEVAYRDTGYTVDRWRISTATTNLYLLPYTTPDEGMNGINRIMISSLTSPKNSTSFAKLSQQVEDARQASGKLVTISFYASTHKNGEIGFIGLDSELIGSTGEKVLIKGTTVEINYKRTKYSVTFAIPTIDALIEENMQELRKTSIKFSWWFTAGSGFSDNLGGEVSNEGVSFFIDSLKIELGDTATDFIPDSYKVNLSKCQRYYSTITIPRYALIPMSRRGSGNTGAFLSDYRPQTEMRPAPLVTMRPSHINLQVWNIGDNSTGGRVATNVEVSDSSYLTGDSIILTFQAPAQTYLGNSLVGAFANYDAVTHFTFDSEIY
jgi:hypothetical protein